MIREIFMPGLPEYGGGLPGKIIEWKKLLGDKVIEGETLVTISTDKAEMDVELSQGGYLAIILAEAGEEVPCGNPIALIAETEAEIEEAKKQAAYRDR